MLDNNNEARRSWEFAAGQDEEGAEGAAEDLRAEGYDAFIVPSSTTNHWLLITNADGETVAHYRLGGN